LEEEVVVIQRHNHQHRRPRHLQLTRWRRLMRLKNVAIKIADLQEENLLS
jgi:hypothetical protein